MPQTQDLPLPVAKKASTRWPYDWGQLGRRTSRDPGYVILYGFGLTVIVVQLVVEESPDRLYLVGIAPLLLCLLRRHHRNAVAEVRGDPVTPSRPWDWVADLLVLGALLAFFVVWTVGVAFVADLTQR